MNFIKVCIQSPIFLWFLCLGGERKFTSATKVDNLRIGQFGVGFDFYNSLGQAVLLTYLQIVALYYSYKMNVKLFVEWAIIASASIICFDKKAKNFILPGPVKNRFFGMFSANISPKKAFFGRKEPLSSRIFSDFFWLF